MSKKVITKHKKMPNGQILLDGSISTEGKHKVPTAGRRAATGAIAMASLAIASVASAASPTPGTQVGNTIEINPTIAAHATKPPVGFTHVTEVRLPHMLAPLPTVSGPGVKTFGSDASQSAFAFAFSFLYKANKIPDLWSPNLNRDPQFIPRLKADLKALAPYLGGDFKKMYLAAIPEFVNPTLTKKSENDAGTWRQILMIPDRLKNGTLPPASTAATDLEAAAPWDLGATASAPVVTVDTVKPYGKVMKISFKWSSKLVFGTKTSLKSIASLNRDVTIWVAKNPDKKDTLHPWLIVNGGANAQAAFGAVSDYVHPLIEKPAK